MRMEARTVRCPLCDRPATLTLFETLDVGHDAVGHRFQFECSTRAHRPSEAELLRLWASDHFRQRNPQAS